MEPERRDRAAAQGELPQQIELVATIRATAVEIEEEEEDAESTWSARKYRDGTGQHENQEEESTAADTGFSNNFSTMELAFASIVAAGVQFGWALQLSLLTPYVQTLGIGHSLASFIWLCGPITGLVVQPCIGIWSDQCTSKWGRRRPFIVTGSLMIIVSVIVIGFSADIGYILGDTHEDCHTFKGLRYRAVSIFVLGFWLLDLANNTVQGPARALLADLAGPDQRNSANAIFSLWMALGNIFGYSAGSSGQWYKWFPFLTSKACCKACANLKAAFLLAVIFLIFCTAVTVIFAKEIPFVVSEEKADLTEREKKRSEDGAPLLMKREDGEMDGPIMVPITAEHINGTAAMNGVESASQNGHRENGHVVHEDHQPVDLGIRPGTIVVNLLMGIRKLPPAMKTVLVVMAFCWLSWFPFVLFDTDYMGREVYRGDPQGDALEVSLYDRGVRIGAFGLLLNSVVLAVSSLVIDPMCNRFGSKHVWALSNYIVFFCMACTTIVTILAGDVHHVDGRRVYVHSTMVKVGAIILFTLLGFPMAITYSVPYSLTAELIADSGGGQGLAMGILNLAVVVPQIVVSLGAGPWDALFGGGNQPAFGLAAVFALIAGIIATKRLPRLSRHGYQRAVVHGFG